MHKYRVTLYGNDGFKGCVDVEAASLSEAVAKAEAQLGPTTIEQFVRVAAAVYVPAQA